MRYKLLTCVLIGLGALWLTSCSTSRKATHEARELKVESVEWKDSSVVQSVEVHDTLREVTTITVDRNDKGDTLRLVQITERDRYRDRDRVRDEHQKTVVKMDTVYIERRDSVQVTEFHGSSVQGEKKSSFLSILK